MMTDNLSKEQRRKNMQSIRSSGSILEERIAKALRKKGIYLRRNVTSLYGKPDFAIKKYKVVIFIDSCFWHGCPLHFIAPKSNQEYWREKIQRNKLRDLEVTNHYTSMNWNLLRVWEHEVKEDSNEVAAVIAEFISNARAH